jgi:hypothetical protein
MSFSLARPARWLALASVLALPATIAGCSVQSGDDNDQASTDAITEVTQSAVKRQSIGNCWIYATASWSESLNKNATGKEANFSESYWSYWHWFDQIANGSVGDTISTGGGFNVAAELINRYGVMSEGDFIPSEANAEMSLHQENAETAINASLKSGALSKAGSHKNRALVRQELDKAWGLTSPVVTQMNRVFGPSTSKTLDKTATTAGTKVMTAQSIAIKVWDQKTQKDVTATLKDAIGTRSGGMRSGPLAWNESSYPEGDQERRDFQKRFQLALHHGVPVVMSWYVDFNAMEPGGQFKKPPKTPGRQGGHMVVMDDYQVSNVPGFGTLKAGVVETREAALTAALDDKATIDFIRIKNSWGSVRVDRDFTTGYHDLWMPYLNGPVKQCETDPVTDMPKTGTCFDATPFESIVVPPGI